MERGLYLEFERSWSSHIHACRGSIVAGVEASFQWESLGAKLLEVRQWPRYISIYIEALESCVKGVNRESRQW